MTKQIFVNLPVKNLNNSVAFFTKLGFTFDAKFTNKDATCMIIGENIFAMLLVENFFKTFTTKEICDTAKNTEVINCISVESRGEVDALINNAVAAGGKEPREKQDQGWMYGRNFQDIDGHLWEVIFADVAAMPQ